jgi:hypothetical protein
MYQSRVMRAFARISRVALTPAALSTDAVDSQPIN